MLQVALLTLLTSATAPLFAVLCLQLSNCAEVFIRLIALPLSGWYTPRNYKVAIDNELYTYPTSVTYKHTHN